MTFATRSCVWARIGAGAALFVVELVIVLGLGAAPKHAMAQDAAATTDCTLGHCPDKKPPSGGPEVKSNGPAMAAPRQAGSNKLAAAVNDAGRPRGSNAPGNFDFYVLSLSWSPGFCATGGAEKARTQCASGADLGFVVHGLWPQYNHGYPSNCGLGARTPSRIALQEVKGLYPDEGLARYEWRRHGTCSGKSPTDYFADVRRARQAITIPPPFRSPHESQDWTPLDIQRAFIAANPRLRPGMLAVECMRSVLREVRICFSKDLHNFVACPEVAGHFCYARQITVPPAH